jgi:colanic acid/amylovoran biosynthesis glycosyltransferase
LLAHGHTVEVFADFHPRADERPRDDPQAAALAAATTYMDVPRLERRFLSAPQRLARCARVAPSLTLAALNPVEYGLRALSLSQLNRLYTLARVPRRYDVVHAHFGMVGDRFRFTSALWRAPLAVSFHGFDYSIWPRRYGADYYRRLFPVAARVVVNSEHTRRKVAALGCPEEKLRLISEQWDMPQFPYRWHERRAGEPFRILTVARLVEKKGVDDGIRAIAQVRRACPDVEYDIVGDGPLRPRLQTLVHELGLNGVVRLHGAEPHATVSALMAEAHALLAPSRVAADGDEEGLGVALLEAQASGLPVIATRHGPFPEVVSHGETGFLAAERAPHELARYLLEIITQPEMALRMGSAGRQRVEQRFAPERITGQYEALYQEMQAMAITYDV